MKMEDDVWPKEVVDSFSNFYMQLNSHPIREEENGNEALVIYHARAWKEWHDRLANKKGMSLVIINEDLLTNIQLKLVTKRAADTAKEAMVIRAAQLQIETPRKRRGREWSTSPSPKRRRVRLGE
ncbi:hypothetical protein BDQ17DRAFT_1329721 [Cyathus striatus]|nr:hypothetical protein BDQ17DRAFT_1329721 [Cyathus striatus]